jgi:hypothetical protein
VKTTFGIFAPRSRGHCRRQQATLACDSGAFATTVDPFLRQQSNSSRPQAGYYSEFASGSWFAETGTMSAFSVNGKPTG